MLGLNTRIPIQTFKKALEFEGLNVDIEEAEWMLANMIYKVSYQMIFFYFYVTKKTYSLIQGYMKGYLSHEKMFLVLSKDNPFPPVSLVVQS